jgi:hypothetical protein
MRREGARSVAAIIVVENTPNRRPPTIITLQEENTQVDRIKMEMKPEWVERPKP